MAVEFAAPDAEVLAVEVHAEVAHGLDHRAFAVGIRSRLGNRRGLRRGERRLSLFLFRITGRFDARGVKIAVGGLSPTAASLAATLARAIGLEQIASRLARGSVRGILIRGRGLGCFGLQFHHREHFIVGHAGEHRIVRRVGGFAFGALGRIALGTAVAHVHDIESIVARDNRGPRIECAVRSG